MNWKSTLPDPTTGTLPCATQRHHCTCVECLSEFRHSSTRTHQRRQARERSQLDFQRARQRMGGTGIPRSGIHRKNRLGPRPTSRRFADRLALEYRIEIANRLERLARHRILRGPAILRHPGKKPRETGVSMLGAAKSARAKALSDERAELESRIAELTTHADDLWGHVPAKPEPTHRLHRGDPMQKREIVAPGALERRASEVLSRYSHFGRGH